MKGANGGNKPNKGQTVKLDGNCYERVNDDPVAKGTGTHTNFSGEIGEGIHDDCGDCAGGGGLPPSVASV